MNWFLYWINNKVSDPWFGTVLFHFKDLKGNSLDNFRFASSDEKKVPGKIVKNGGWHFSYLGGVESVKRKLEAHPFQGYKALIAILLDKLKYGNSWHIHTHTLEQILIGNSNSVYYVCNHCK